MTDEKRRRRAVASKKWRVTHPERRALGAWKQHLRKQYGITSEEYEVMRVKQAGKCAICGHAPGPEEKRLGVDHDHATGKIRELLCGQCNAGLGNYADSPARLSLAVAYLHKHKANGT